MDTASLTRIAKSHKLALEPCNSKGRPMVRDICSRRSPLPYLATALLTWTSLTADVVEAQDDRSLSRGMNGLAVRIASRFNAEALIRRARVRSSQVAVA